ncbi:hypothetical protein DICA4_E30350 [Diutina catenulata]
MVDYEADPSYFARPSTPCSPSGPSPRTSPPKPRPTAAPKGPSRPLEFTLDETELITALGSESDDELTQVRLDYLMAKITMEESLGKLKTIVNERRGTPEPLRVPVSPPVFRRSVFSESSASTASSGSLEPVVPSLPAPKRPSAATKPVEPLKIHQVVQKPVSSPPKPRLFSKKFLSPKSKPKPKPDDAKSSVVSRVDSLGTIWEHLSRPKSSEKTPSSPSARRATTGSLEALIRKSTSPFRRRSTAETSPCANKLHSFSSLGSPVRFKSHVFPPPGQGFDASDFFSDDEESDPSQPAENTLKLSAPISFSGSLRNPDTESEMASDESSIPVHESEDPFDDCYHSQWYQDYAAGFAEGYAVGRGQRRVGNDCWFKDF